MQEQVYCSFEIYVDFYLCIQLLAFFTFHLSNIPVGQKVYRPFFAWNFCFEKYFYFL